MKARLMTLMAALCLLPGLPANSQAPPNPLYDFTMMAETGGAFGNFGLTTTLNSAGSVAFSASMQGGGNGIFAWQDGELTAIGMVDDPGDPMRFINPWISDQGAVAFTAAMQVAEEQQFRSVLVGSGGGLTTIADTTAYGGFLFPGTPSINNQGTVAFQAITRDGFNGIFTVSADGATTVIDGSYDPFSRFSNSPRINNQGVVSFFRSASEGGVLTQGIFAGSGGPLTPIATVGPNSPFVTFAANTAINDAGTVAFQAFLQTGGSGTFLGSSSGGPFTIFADTAGPFSSFTIGAPSLNNLGALGVQAVLDEEGGGVFRRGLFTGPDRVADKIIEIGDPLFGSTVASLYHSGGRGLNEAGQVSFFAELEDGRRVIARANVIPEPGTLALLAGAAVPGACLALRRRRRGR